MRHGLVAVVVTLGVAGCGGSKPKPQNPEPARAQPLPTAGISGQDVAVYPLTMLLAADTLHWDSILSSRRASLDKADSIIGALLVERSPEVNWVLPPKLRRSAAQAPGMLTNPDQMATSLLRGPMAQIPDPLRGQMRTLNGMANARFALVPASLIYVRAPSGLGRAELTLVMADVRTGEVGYHTVARGEGPDPWTALRAAVKSLVPGLP